MQQKARMTFRFEPSKPSSRPLEAVSETRAAKLEENRPASDRSDFNTTGPLQDDPYALEEIIRRTGTLPSPVHAAPTATVKEPALAPMEMQVSEETNRSEWPVLDESILQSHLMTGKMPRGEGPSWWKVFASVAGAIATGALFGYLVLTLFTGESPFPGTAATGTDAPAQAQAEATTVSPHDSSAASTQPASGTVQGSIAGSELPAETYYMLQYGVFRSEESMNAAVEELKGKGFPAFGDRTDGYRVYAGAAATKEEAEVLAGQMPNLEIFVKPSAVDPVKPAISEGAEALSAFVQRSHELTKELAGMTVRGLQDEVPQQFDAGNLAALRETHRKWLETISAVDRLGEPAREAGRSMVQALNAAMVSIDDYGRKISRFHLWSVQADVMEVISADRALRSSAASVPQN